MQEAGIRSVQNPDATAIRSVPGAGARVDSKKSAERGMLGDTGNSNGYAGASDDPRDQFQPADLRGQMDGGRVCAMDEVCPRSA
jgi:hypothetical protein